MLVWNCVAVICVWCSPYTDQQLPTHSHVSFLFFLALGIVHLYLQLVLKFFIIYLNGSYSFFCLLYSFLFLIYFFFRLLLLKGDLRSVLVCKLVSLVFNESR